MVSLPGCHDQHFPKVGISPNRRVCNMEQQEVSAILLLPESQSGLACRRLSPSLEEEEVFDLVSAEGHSSVAIINSLHSRLFTSPKTAGSSGIIDKGAPGRSFGFPSQLSWTVSIR